MSTEIITINEKTYKAKDFNFNFLCFLGECGIEVDEIPKKILPAFRCYLAYCMDTDVETAGAEFEQHCIKHPADFNGYIEVFNDKAMTSDFFLAIGNTKETASKKDTEKSEKKGKEA